MSRRRSSFSAMTRINPQLFPREPQEDVFEVGRAHLDTGEIDAVPRRHGDHGRENGRPVVRGQFEVAVDLVHVVDVVELATGDGKLVECRRVAGQMDLVPPAVGADERIGRALRDQVTVINDADPVAQLGGFLHVVRRVEDGDTEPPDRLEDGVAALRVDAHRRLVEDEQFGPVQQAGRHVGPPFHATRVRTDAVLPTIGQSHELERLTDARLELLSRQPVELPEEGEVLHGREIRVEGEILGDEADGRLRLERPALEAGDGDVPLVGDGQSTEHRDGGGLAGTVRAQQAVTLALPDDEGDAVHGLTLAVALPQAVATQHGRRDQFGRGCDAAADRLFHTPSPGKRGASLSTLPEQKQGIPSGPPVLRNPDGRVRRSNATTGLLQSATTSGYEAAASARISARSSLKRKPAAMVSSSDASNRCRYSFSPPGYSVDKVAPSNGRCGRRALRRSHRSGRDPP